jgi:hypothetical protein
VISVKSKPSTSRQRVGSNVSLTRTVLMTVTLRAVSACAG